MADLSPLDRLDAHVGRMLTCLEQIVARQNELIEGQEFLEAAQSRLSAELAALRRRKDGTD